MHVEFLNTGLHNQPRGIGAMPKINFLNNLEGGAYSLNDGSTQTQSAALTAAAVALRTQLLADYDNEAPEAERLVPFTGWTFVLLEVNDQPTQIECVVEAWNIVWSEEDQEWGTEIAGILNGFKSRSSISATVLGLIEDVFDAA